MTSITESVKKIALPSSNQVSKVNKNANEAFKLVNKETATSIPLNEDGGNIEMLNADESKEAFGKKWKTSSDIDVARYRLSRANFQLFGLATKRLAILKQMEIDLSFL